ESDHRDEYGRQSRHLAGQEGESAHRIGRQQIPASLLLLGSEGERTDEQRHQRQQIQHEVQQRSRRGRIALLQPVRRHEQQRQAEETKKGHEGIGPWIAKAKAQFPRRHMRCRSHICPSMCAFPAWSASASSPCPACPLPFIGPSPCPSPSVAPLPCPSPPPCM